MACAAQERTPDWPAWENASFRNHADHTATPEFRERMAELHWPPAQGGEGAG